MPIYRQCEARSAEWFKLRLGIPTASEFHKIVTAGGDDGKKPKVSEQAPGYAHRLLAELMVGHILEDEDYQSQFMERGTELEDKAIEAFEFARAIETRPGGFITDDLMRYGCSPDRIVGDNALLEMKCPAAQTHVRYLIDKKSIIAEKRPQIQGQLLVSDREFVELVSFHPEMPIAIVRATRDEEYIKILKCALQTFCETLTKMRETLEQQYGPFPGIGDKVPIVHEGLGVSDADIDMILKHGASVPRA